MSQGPKIENRGGYRPGAGRKPGPQRTLSAQLVAEMLRKARKYARRHKKTIDEVLLDIIYAEKSRDVDKLASIKLFKEHTSPKLTEGGSADTALAAKGPAVFLPQHRPTLTAVEGGKAA
jgi:hypothetical protein